MIPRKFARKLLNEFLSGLEETEAETGGLAGPEELFALRDNLLEHSPLVIRGTENVEQKGRRYLTEGRLLVEKIDPSGLIVASCRGSGATYQLGYDPKRHQWRCTCSLEKGGSRTRLCSHLAALKLVVDEPRQEAA